MSGSYCLECGYRVDKGRSEVCPECGRMFDLGDPKSYAKSRRKVNAIRLIRTAAALCIISGCLWVSLYMILYERDQTEIVWGPNSGIHDPFDQGQYGPIYGFFKVNYRVENRLAKYIFHPLHCIDRRVRYAYWVYEWDLNEFLYEEDEIQVESLGSESLGEL